MSDDYRYHATAEAFRADIVLPFEHRIPPQAALTLKPSGGYDSDSVEQFNFRNLIKVQSAVTVVSGSKSESTGSFDSLATVTIVGLDILGMVTADRVVARIASSDGPDGHFIIPLGSHFDNLKIAGHRVQVVLATDTFTRLGTHQQVRDAYNDDTGFRSEFDKLRVAQRTNVPALLQKYLPTLSSIQGDAEITCSLAREINGVPGDWQCAGHVIRVPEFGTIRLAEFTMQADQRTLTMIQIALGSTPSANVLAGGPVSGNGPGWGT